MSTSNSAQQALKERPAPAAAGNEAMTFDIQPTANPTSDKDRAAKRLLGDTQDVEEIGDLEAGIAVDEMHDPVMGAAEAENFEFIIGVTDEVAIGKEQQLDDIPAQFVRPGGLGRALETLRIRGVGGL